MSENNIESFDVQSPINTYRNILNRQYFILPNRTDYHYRQYTTSLNRINNDFQPTENLILERAFHRMQNYLINQDTPTDSVNLTDSINLTNLSIHDYKTVLQYIENLSGLKDLPEQMCSICFSELTSCIDETSESSESSESSETSNSVKKICKISCQHCFHEECIIKWLNKNKSCPNCRAECQIISNGLTNGLDGGSDNEIQWTIKGDDVEITFLNNHEKYTLDLRDITLVQSQTGCSIIIAIKSLVKHNKDIVDAIFDIE